MNPNNCIRPVLLLSSAQGGQEREASYELYWISIILTLKFILKMEWTYLKPEAKRTRDGLEPIGLCNQ